MVGMQTVDDTYYFKKNLQGDITAIINDSGAEVVSYNYDAWGNVLSVNDTSNTGLAEKNPYTYRGYYRDNETGFYYLQSRYYDAEGGRFLNADTTNVLHNSSGISDKNLYAYCGNNAINNIDNTGQKGIKTSYLALILDIALSIACLYGAVTYSVIGAGFKALYKTVGYKAFRMLVKKPLVRKAVKAYFKFMKDVKRLARKYLRAIIPNLKESALTSLITKWPL